MAGKCLMCGTPSTIYLFCKKCNKLKEEGKIIKCKDCGTWHLSDKPCKCKKIEEIKINTNETTKNIKTTSECIICKEEAEGKLFCKSCYFKYKDKTISIKVSNCKDIEIMDEYYKGEVHCEDGHIVKSLHEKIIDDYLFHHNIPHAYEKALHIDKETTLKPDFYLPISDKIKNEIYIEHWGIENKKDYENSKEYKIKIYEKNNITLICTNYKDMTNIGSVLERQLKTYEVGKINW